MVVVVVVGGGDGGGGGGVCVSKGYQLLQSYHYTATLLLCLKRESNSGMNQANQVHANQGNDNDITLRMYYIYIKYVG